MIKDATNINEIVIGINVQIEQEIQTKGKRTLEFSNPAFEVTSRILQNVIMTIESGRKFKIVE